MSGLIQRFQSAISAQPNIDNAQNIQGWMTIQELLWLGKQAKKHQRIVEIGSYLGRSTRALADNTVGIVYAIDDFKGPRDVKLPKMMREGCSEVFMWGLNDLLQSGKVLMVVEDHASVTPRLCDMVFIDGSHEYEHVKRDIELWKACLMDGGLICGHDYTNIISVKQAVDESFKKVKIVKGTSIWYV